MLDFIIVGAQKAATTYVQAVLSGHPCLYIPRGEIPVFEDYPALEDQKQELQKAFDGVDTTSLLLGIKRPNYLAKSGIARRIYEFNPNAQIIVVLRKPEKRAVAAYFHYIKYGFIKSFEADLGLDLILNNKHPQPPSKDILTYGLYASQLKVYFDLFGAENIYVGIQERLLKKPQSETRRLFEFLGVEPLDPLPAVGRPQAVVYNFKRLRFITAFNNLVYKYNQERTRLSLRTFGLPIAKGIELLDRYVLSKFYPGNDADLSSTTLKQLEEYYAEDKAELRKLLNDPIPEWD